MTSTLYEDLLESDACADGLAFLKLSKTARRAWETCQCADWMCWALARSKLWTDAQAREFACDCAEHTLHFFEDEYPNDTRPRDALAKSRSTITDNSPVAISARAAAGAAAGDAAWTAAGTAARAAAWAAARAAARAAAEDAAGDAAGAAARAAAGTAAGTAAEAAAGDAAWAAAWTAAWAAAWTAAWAAENLWQANRLREIVNPFKT